jgi:hypothetical protein
MDVVSDPGARFCSVVSFLELNALDPWIPATASAFLDVLRVIFAVSPAHESA